MPLNNTNHQSGNVFIIILVAVFLFGALIFTFSKSGSRGLSNMDKQQAKLAAQEIINYSALIEIGIGHVLQNGCSESELSFDTPSLTGYINPDSPIDLSCNIFDKEGGKVPFTSLSNKTTDGSNMLFMSAVAVVKIGTDSAANSCTQDSCTELTMFLGPLDTNLCNEINRQMDAPNITAESISGYGSKFTGSFTNSDQLGDSPSTYRAISSACMNGNGSPSGLYFYKVLLAR